MQQIDNKFNFTVKNSTLSRRGLKKQKSDNKGLQGRVKESDLESQRCAPRIYKKTQYLCGFRDFGGRLFYLKKQPKTTNLLQILHFYATIGDDWR